MKTNIVRYLFICVHVTFLNYAIFGYTTVSAQTDSLHQKVTVYLKDGKKISGNLVSRNKSETVIVTKTSDTIFFAQAKVLAVVNEKTTALPQNIFENQFEYRYFLFQSAVPVVKKRWNYSNQFILINNFNYGISNRLSAGVSFFTLDPSALVSPKMKFCFNPNSDIKFSISAQHLYIRIWTSDRGNVGYNLGYIQALLTKGNSQNNLTLGVGKFISQSGIQQGYIGTIALTKRISNKTSFITENNLLIGYDSRVTVGLLSAGVRFNRKMHAFDLGVFAPALIDNFQLSRIVLPFISYNLRIN